MMTNAQNQNYIRRVESLPDSELIAEFIDQADLNQQYVDCIVTEMRARGLSSKILDNLLAEALVEKESLLSMGTQPHFIWVIMGYMSCVTGLVGLIWGYNFLKSRHRPLDGDLHFLYNESARAHGRRMIWLSLIFLAVHLGLWILE